MIFNMDPPLPWPESYTPANVLDHHFLGYSYESDPAPTITAAAIDTAKAMEEEQRRRIAASQTGQIKHVVPLFPLMKEIRVFSSSPSRLRSKRKMSKSVGSKKKKKVKRRGSR